MIAIDHARQHFYFSATVAHGRLLVQGISGEGRWEPKRLTYWHESMVDRVMDVLAGDGKVHSVQELQAIIQASRSGRRIIQIWIHETLEDAVRRLYEQHSTSTKSA